jgi:hemin uptake protein HemP
MQASLTATASFPPAHTEGQAERATAVSCNSNLPAGAMDSHELLKGQKAVTIMHNGAIYRLQATKLGKLILTK